MTRPDRKYADRTDTSIRPSWSANPGFLNDAHRRVYEETKDLPGWQMEADSHKLFEMAYFAGDTILEIGTYGGRSCVVELRGALSDPRRTSPPQLFGIDIAPTSIEMTYDTLHAAGLAPHALLYRGTLQEFVAEHAIRPTMVFLDGDHRYDGVRADLDTLSRYLPPGIPIFCHDFSNPENDTGEYGVKKAVLEWEAAGFGELLGTFGCGVLYLTTARCQGSGTSLSAEAFQALRRRVHETRSFAGDHPRTFFTDAGVPDDPVRLRFTKETTYGKESYTWNEKPGIVQWIRTPAVIRHEHRGAAGPHTFRVALATIDPPRMLRLSVNGKRTRREYVVYEILWASGHLEASWDVALEPGENVFELSTDSAPHVLPGDGREVAFLVVSDPILHPA